jgi:sRNA-binding protein
MLGWNAWSIGVKDKELEQAKEQVREDKAEASKEKQKKKREEKKAQEEKEKQEKGIKRVRCIALTNSLKRCKNTTENSNKRCWAHQ